MFFQLFSHFPLHVSLVPPSCVFLRLARVAQARDFRAMAERPMTTGEALMAKAGDIRDLFTIRVCICFWREPAFKWVTGKQNRFSPILEDPPPV